MASTAQENERYFINPPTPANPLRNWEGGMVADILDNPGLYSRFERRTHEKLLKNLNEKELADRFLPRDDQSTVKFRIYIRNCFNISAVSQS
jgi:hypothetical protein